MSSIYKRKGTWYIKTKVGDRYQYISLKKHFNVKTKKDAERIKQQFDYGHLQPEFLTSSEGDTDIVTLYEKYDAWAKANRTTSTRDLRDTAVYYWVEFTGQSFVEHVTPDDIEKFKLEYQAHVQESRDTSGARAVNAALDGLRAIVNRALRQNWYSGPNPWANFEPIPEPKKVVRILTPKQFKKVLEVAAAYSQDMHLYFALGLYTGMRKSEIDAAQWGWVDGKHLIVRADENFIPKDKDERAITIDKPLASILKKYHGEEEEFIIAPAAEYGKNRYRYEVRKHFNAVTKSARVTWLTPHLMRHAWVSYKLNAGIPIHRVAREAGHSTTYVTDRYGHLIPD